MNIEDTENTWLKILSIFRVGAVENQHRGWDDDLSSVLSTHIRLPTTACNYSSGALSGLCGYTHPHTQISKNNQV